MSTVIRDRSTASLPFTTSFATWCNALSWSAYGLLVAHDIMVNTQCGSISLEFLHYATYCCALSTMYVCISDSSGSTFYCVCADIWTKSSGTCPGDDSDVFVRHIRHAPDQTSCFETTVLTGEVVAPCEWFTHSLSDGLLIHVYVLFLLHVS